MDSQLEFALAALLEGVLDFANCGSGTAIAIDNGFPSPRIVGRCTRGKLHFEINEQLLESLYGQRPSLDQSGRSTPVDLRDMAAASSGEAWLANESGLLATLLCGVGTLQIMILLSGAGRPYLSHVELARLSDIRDQGIRVLDRYLMVQSATKAGLNLECIGNSVSLRKVEALVKRTALRSDMPVLITGERGTGKEFVAYALHYYSPRRAKPFLTVNCAALQHELFSSELFGHRKGSFTGALQDRLGKFRSAQGGTLFLDEITEMPNGILTSLLRAIEQQEIQPLGFDKPLKVNVRVLAATNKDIANLAATGKFPADLYDRLNALRIHVPALRERREDIPILVCYFMKKFCAHLKSDDLRAACRSCAVSNSPVCIPSATMGRLVAHDWPGNIRELKNTVLRLIMESNDLGVSMQFPLSAIRKEKTLAGEANSPSLDLRQALKGHIVSALDRTHWNKSAAARLLGIPLSTLVSKMKRLDIIQPNS